MEHQGFPFVFSFSRLLSHHVADDSMEKRKRNFFFADGPHFADPASLTEKSSKFNNSQRKSILTRSAIWVINNQDQAKVSKSYPGNFIRLWFHKICFLSRVRSTIKDNLLPLIIASINVVVVVDSTCDSYLFAAFVFLYFRDMLVACNVIIRINNRAKESERNEGKKAVERWGL